MTREQQAATRKLEGAQDDWLRAYGWQWVIGGWVHPNQIGTVTRWDAMQLTRAQPLIFGAAVYERAR